MLIKNLAEIAHHYDGYIVDLWGVLHNGKEAFPAAVLALTELKKQNKKIVLLSNSPRRIAGVEKRLAEMGILRDIYDDIYTSGEDCYQALEDKSHPLYASLGQRYYHIGGDKSKSMAADLSRVAVNTVNEADFILVTGTKNWEASVDPYLSILQEACKIGIPLICANSDLTVLYGKDSMICAGLIAQTYEEIGGKSYYHGKPHLAIYKKILGKFGLIPQSRLLAIGDSLRTDIQGGAKAGIDTLLILSGIHNQFNDKPFEAICDFSLNNFQIHPNYVAPQLQF